MTISLTKWKRTLAILAAALLVLGPASAWAVIKNVKIMQDGKPVANQTVSLRAPSGKAVSSDAQGQPFVTDANGNLEIDLADDDEEDGKWMIIWPGGSQALNISAGGVSPWVLGTAAAVSIAGIVAVADSDNGSDATDDGYTPPGGGGGTPGTIDGDWTMASVNISSNPGGHPNNFPGTSWTATTSGSNLDLGVSSVGITGTLSGTVDGSGNFNVSGSCTYQGFSTTCAADGQFDTGNGTWSGNASAGNDGGLPGGQPIDVSFSGNNAPP